MNKEVIQSNNDLLSEIIAGLSKDKKTLPSKLFYDEKGSKLFDKICRLQEYYPTRTESVLMKNNIKDIAAQIEPLSILIEFGSGSSIKTRMLLREIKSLSAYIPIDISKEHLLKSANVLKERFPGIDIHPFQADYTKPFKIPKIKKEYKHIVAYFPGSTIGNFTSEEAKKFLSSIAEVCGQDGGLLIGIDMVKDSQILEAAYNDSKGVTAQFNKNIFSHINNKFGFNFNPKKFEHKAPYNLEKNRIEMNLISLEKQIVTNGIQEFLFEKEESIITEYSHKYTIDSFSQLASGNFKLKKYWTDEKKFFSVLFLTVK